MPVDDGLVFDAGSVSAQPIRESDAYQGVRVSIDARLHTARLAPKVDVNVGDPIWPAPQEIELPRLLGGQPLRLRGYSLPMVLAEKAGHRHRPRHGQHPVARLRRRLPAHRRPSRRRW